MIPMDAWMLKIRTTVEQANATEHQERENTTDDSTKNELKTGLKYKLIQQGNEVQMRVMSGGYQRPRKEPVSLEKH